MSAMESTGFEPTALADLESPRAKLVYLYLSATDGATLEELCSDLDIATGTALVITRTLHDRGLLVRQHPRLVVA